MSIMVNSSRLKSIHVNGNRLKKVMCMDKRIWSSAVTITFIEAGVETAIEYEYGATVSRTTAPSGATFVGWSTDPSGANPVASFVATQDARYYRVVRYANYSASKSADPGGFGKELSGSFGAYFDGARYSSGTYRFQNNIGVPSNTNNIFMNIGARRLASISGDNNYKNVSFSPSNFKGQPAYYIRSGRDDNNCVFVIEATGKTAVG